MEKSRFRVAQKKRFDKRHRRTRVQNRGRHTAAAARCVSQVWIAGGNLPAASTRPDAAQNSSAVPVGNRERDCPRCRLRGVFFGRANSRSSGTPISENYNKRLGFRLPLNVGSVSVGGGSSALGEQPFGWGAVGVRTNGERSTNGP